MPVSLPQRVVLERPGHGRLPVEETLLKTQADALKIPVAYASTKQILRRRFLVARTDLVAGNLPFVTQALHQLELGAPRDDSYPWPLGPWLRRQVLRRHTLGEVEAEVTARGTPIFVKPLDRLKRFTGFVLTGPHDPRLAGVSRRQRVWTSDLVAFQSEWRVYTAHGQILDIQPYEGDPTLVPDRGEIEAAVAVHHAQFPRLGGFAVDFGVDSQGRTTLVEYNGGLSVGAYGTLRAEHYWAMCWSHWAALTGADALPDRT